MDTHNNLGMRWWLMWRGTKTDGQKKSLSKLQIVETSLSPASLRCQRGQRAKSRGRVTEGSLLARRRKTFFLRCFSSLVREKSLTALHQNLPSFRHCIHSHGPTNQAFACCFFQLLLKMVKDLSQGGSERKEVCLLVNCEPLFLREYSLHPFHSQCIWGGCFDIV